MARLTAGETYARAFLDVLADIPLAHLGDHLDKHYDVSWDGKRCLRYQPGINTRLPNRYYRFRHSGVDVFAIDSNTLLTTAKPSTSNVKRRQELRSLEQQQANLYRDWRTAISAKRIAMHSSMNLKRFRRNASIFNVISGPVNPLIKSN